MSSYVEQNVTKKIEGIRGWITERRCIGGVLPPIEGYRYDNIFGIHRAEYKAFGNSWAVTHLPSGWILHTYPTKRMAENSIAMLFTLPVPWKTKSPKVLRKYKRIIFTILPPPKFEEI